MAEEKNKKDTPPPETPQAETTPPAVTHDPVPGPVASRKKEVEVTRIPEPVVVGKLVVFPRAYGVDYTVGGKAVTQAQQLKGPMKVKAVAKPGYKFATGLKQTFNVNS